MSDSLMTIIGIFLAVVLMFIFPIMEITGKSDEVSQTMVQVAVSDFVNKASVQGKITQFDYNELVQKLYSTGNSYDIQIEVKVLDDNPRRDVTTGNSAKLGEYKYYSVYTNTILEKVLGKENGEYILKKDDYIVVTVKNTNMTMGTQFKNMFYKLIGKETYTIGTSSSSVVVNGGDNEKIPVAMSKIVIADPEIYKETTLYYTKTNSIFTNVTFLVDVTGSMNSVDSGSAIGGSRIEKVKKCMQKFLTGIDMPTVENASNPIINVIKFGTIAEKITDDITTQNELTNFLNNDFNNKFIITDTDAFFRYENYDIGLEETKASIATNKARNSNKNVIIILTDGNHEYNSSYCLSHNGNMSEYAEYFINGQGTTVYSIGVYTKTDVLRSMVLEDKYTTTIYNTAQLDNVLNDIKGEITEEIKEKKLISEDEKIRLEGIKEISDSKQLKIKITGEVEKEIFIKDDANLLIEKIDDEYWILLEELAVTVGGRKILDNCEIELYY